MSVVITKDNFTNEVLKSGKTVLLDFWATWCVPCQRIAPILEEVAKEKPEIIIGKINIDEQPELAQTFRIESIPTLIVIKDGKISKAASGVRPKSQILEMLEG